MTTIAVARKGTTIAIAADTLTSFGNTRVPSTYKGEHAKIIEFAGNFIGICGSSAHHLALRSLLLRERSLDLSSRQAVFESFLRLHPTLKEDYYLNPREHEHGPYESSQIEALIANPHGLFGIFSYREAFEYNRFWAIGSGYRFALGAMHAVYEHTENAEDIVRAGVEAGCEFDNATGAPVIVHTIDVPNRRATDRAATKPNKTDTKRKTK
jgi:ATP-dependent HslUV protease, peptidase subunit HslV